jgi:predicted amidohydrolase YtcJ
VVAKKGAPEAHQGDWLLGRGWDQNDWPSKQFPTRASLDAALPKLKVYLRRIDGHAAWASSEALAAAGIARDTKDPEGGRIIRDAKGEPTGVLIDNAMDLVELKLPQPSEEQLKRRLKAAIEKCASVGLTSIHDAGMELSSFEQLQSWDAVGALPIRIYAMADAQGADADAYLGRGTFEGKHLRMKGAKLLADGALGSRGAALETPYSDEPASTGLLLMSEQVLQQKAKAFSERGFQVAIHAIGDRANRIVIDLLSKLEKTRPGSRHRVEHAQLLTGPLVEKLKTAGLVVSFQPTHATSDMPWAAARVGEDRLKFAYAWRSVLETGAHVAFGSDFPVEKPDVLLGLYAARTRQDVEGKPAGGWHPEQKVTGAEALAGFTSGAAYAEFAEERRGILKVGYDADFTALSVDPVDGDPAGLPKAQVLVTVVDGVDVYRK